MKRIIISPENGLFLGLLAASLLLFAASLASFITEAPSKRISRELPLASLEYGFSKSSNSHVSVLEYPERETACIIAVDGIRTRILELNIRGEIQRDISLDLDLSRASYMEVFSPSYGRIELYYLYKGLRKVDIYPGVQNFSEIMLAENTADFSSCRDRLVFKRPDGLYGIAPGKAEGTVKLADGDIQSFILTGDDEGDSSDLFLLYVKGDVPSDTELTLAWLDGDLDTVKSRRIELDGDPKYYRSLADAKAGEEVLSALFVLPNRRMGVNELSLLRMDTAAGVLKQSFRISYPFYKSRYRIIEDSARELRFVHQIDDGRGVNLGVTTVDSDGQYEMHPYSKTLSLSKFGGFFSFGAVEGLVFSDIDYEHRQLMFASSDPAVVKRTTSWLSAGFLYPVTTTLALFLVALVIGSLYLLPTSALPLALCGLMNFIKAPFRREALNVLTVALIHIAVKMTISYGLLHRYGNFRFTPLLIGRGGLIYPVLILSSIISFILTIRVNRGFSYRNSSYVYFYIRFGLYDYILHVSLVLIYVTASVLLAKI